ncbi:Estrogen receptor beta [Liparis tanakae]|uniref:Estrogen receptor beta n=1 Tax=Liparis tanakae TaxID=230148 RepID=A0A4Z2G7S7_9TELE|nr:Estrogen receptor beta [Liparis tanakae]
MCLSASEGGEELQSRSKLLRLLDAVTDALVWAIAKTGLTFRQQYTRLAHLLMMLSHIRHASLRISSSRPSPSGGRRAVGVAQHGVEGAGEVVGPAAARLAL